MQDIELLQYVHETAEMGKLGLRDILGQIQDAKLKNAVQAQIDEYSIIAGQSAERLRRKGENPKDPKYIHAIRGIGYKLEQ